MKTWIFLLAGFLATGLASGQRHKLATVNAETPEGKLIQQFATEQDAAKKLALMEQFAAEFPKHDGAGWVLTQLQAAYLKAGEHDKVLAAGEKLLTIAPDDLDAAYANLKASEGKKDADGIIKWSGTTSELAKKQAATPKPTEADQEENWKYAVDFAKQVDTYTEYALYSAALQSPDHARAMALVESLEQRNPSSQYLPQVLGRYAGAAQALKATDKAVALGERAFGRGQFNEDMLLAMADALMQQKKQPDKVIAYSAKVVEVMSSKPKPDGYSDADWEKKKAGMLGLAYWMSGVQQAAQNKFAGADKDLRAALPYIKDNDQLNGMALFYLGLANYQMGRGKNRAQMADALRFSQQSAAIKSPVQGQAARNVKVITSEMGK